VYFYILSFKHLRFFFQALARDGFKCVVSGLIDNPSYNAFPTAFPANTLTCKTQCCHIFSESAQDGDKKARFADDRCLSSFKTEYAGAAMAILKMFNFDFHSLLGSGVNTLHNVVTMDTELRNMWDDSEFWLEEVIGQVCLVFLPPNEHFYSPIPTTS
jgi:hypothetical protein